MEAGFRHAHSPVLGKFSLQTNLREKQLKVEKIYFASEVQSF